MILFQAFEGLVLIAPKYLYAPCCTVTIPKCSQGVTLYHSLPQFPNKPTIQDLCAKQMAIFISQVRTLITVFGIKTTERPGGHAENCCNLGTDSNQFVSSLIPGMDFSNLCLILISPSEPSVYKNTVPRYNRFQLLSVEIRRNFCVLVVLKLILPRESHTQSCSRK